MNILAPNAAEITGALELLAALSNPAAVKKALEGLQVTAKEVAESREAAVAGVREATRLRQETEAVQEATAKLAAETAALQAGLSAKEQELLQAKDQFERDRAVAERTLSEQGVELSKGLLDLEERLKAVAVIEGQVAERERTIAAREEAALAKQAYYEKAIADLKAVLPAQG